MPRARQALTVEQEPHLIVRSFPCRYSPGFVIEEHAHGFAQLLYAITGAMTVHTTEASWMIPPGKAVLIPAGFRHSIRMWGSVEMRSLCFPAGPEECRVLGVTPLLRELILTVIGIGALDSRIPAQSRLAGVILDQIDAEPIQPLALPMPTDPRALAVASHLIAQPACEESLDALAYRFAASRRTLERLFQRDTGMSFGLWRQKVRLLDSIRLLAEGKSVTEVSFDSGYRSVSAFIGASNAPLAIRPANVTQRGKLRFENPPRPQLPVLPLARRRRQVEPPFDGSPRRARTPGDRRRPH